MKKAIIVDLDSTLADNDHRQHYIADFYSDDGTDNDVPESKKADWDSFNAEIPNDTLNEWCYSILSLFYQQGVDILVVTGRGEDVRKTTEQWLLLNDLVPYDKMFMRERTDFRASVVYKREVLENEILGKYDVLFALDDDLTVCNMYYEMGIPTLKVIRPEDSK